MSLAFGDERLEARLRAVLEECAEEAAAHARPAAEVASELAPRLRAADGAASRLARLVRLGVLAAALMLVLGLIAYGAGRPRPPVHLGIGVDMPLGAEIGVDSVVNAIQIAVRAQRGGAAGFMVDLPPDAVLSDTVIRAPDPSQGAANMRQLAADPRLVAVIGPYNSNVAEAEIPVANAAGILECSPSNTAPNLTTGDAAGAFRPRPDRPSYVRVAATDDSEALGVARFIVHNLGARTVFVISAGPFAGNRTISVDAALGRNGGAIVGAASLGASSPVEIAGQIDVLKPEAIFFDGLGTEGATLLGALSPAALRLPFVSLDGILDGPRSTPGTFLNLAGDRAAHAYGIFPAGYDPARAPQMEASYRLAFGGAPARAALGGYACAQVIIDALQGLDLPPQADSGTWRDALRKSIAEGGATYQTVLGGISFDAHGDVQPARVSAYRADLAAGDWRFDQVVESGGPG